MLCRSTSQRGFTLVELSIVLVIIGLIIGGVLAGQQVIQNAEVTNTVNAMQAYAAQFKTYEQNYGALPGNDSQAQQRFPNGVGIQNGSGNGSLKGNFDDTGGNTETQWVWADLRAAGLVKNQAATANTTGVQPLNPFGGIYGFQNGAFSGAVTSPVLCLNNVPGTAALAIDARLDDGVPNTGNIQATTYTSGQTGEATTGTAVNTCSGSSTGCYQAGTNYTLCMQID